MNVPLLDLQATFAQQELQIRAAVDSVLQSQHFIGGPEVLAFEAEVAAYVGVPHGVACASGSDALLLALMALDIGPGDEVITTPFTFFATVSAIHRVGATAVLVDIEPRSFNLDLAAVEAAITRRTRAIIPVHLFGQCVDLDALEALSARHGVSIIEDAAQAIGARHRGRAAGSVGVMGSFSFYPSKNLGGYGDGGLLTCTDPALAQKLQALRSHGNFPRKYYHRWVGLNSRLDALQAAVLRVKLTALDGWHEARRANAARYRALLSQMGLDRVVTPPWQDPDAYHIYNQFCIRAPDRDALQAHLKAAGVGTEVYYPLPLHLQECFADLGHGPGAFPEAEAAAHQALALPIYPELSPAQQGYVVEQIATFYEHRSHS